MVILSLPISNNSIETKNKSFKLQRRNIRVSVENKRIHLKRNSNKSVKELNDSIIYAKRIQDGMMFKEAHLGNLFEDAFIMHKPKDIVSGDFYWFAKIDNKIIVAVADCTGHGIPGAFMSVLGITLLNQIVIEEKNADVSLILHFLDRRLRKAFVNSMDNSDNKNCLFDGMDIALCCFDLERKNITFSGAFRPFYHISKNSIYQYEGSKYPIGGERFENHRNYESVCINYEAGDRVFLCSDGYGDQFGGSYNKKFMTRMFKQYLLKTSKYSTQTQYFELERVFSEWKGNNEQTDDVLVVGIQM